MIRLEGTGILAFWGPRAGVCPDPLRSPARPATAAMSLLLLRVVLFLVLPQIAVIWRPCKHEQLRRLQLRQEQREIDVGLCNVWQNGLLEQRCWNYAFTIGGDTSACGASRTDDPCELDWPHSAKTWRTVSQEKHWPSWLHSWKPTSLPNCAKIFKPWRPCSEKESERTTFTGLSRQGNGGTRRSTSSCSTCPEWFWPTCKPDWNQSARRSLRQPWLRSQADAYHSRALRCFFLCSVKKDSGNFSNGTWVFRAGRRTGWTEHRMPPQPPPRQPQVRATEALWSGKLGKHLRPGKYRQPRRAHERRKRRLRRRGISGRLRQFRGSKLVSCIFKGLRVAQKLCTVWLELLLAATVASIAVQPPYPASPLQHQIGRPGPKSRGRLCQHTLCMLLFLSSLLIQPCRAVQSTDTRVGGSPHLDPPEVTAQLHHRLHGLTNHNGDSLHATVKSGHKRAFLRAQKRAARAGGTRYRGRWFSAGELGVTQSTVRPKPSLTFTPKIKPRLSFLSWNASGLTTERNAELKTWLGSEPGCHTDLVAIQETHWKGAMEYQWDKFMVVHSGGSKSEAGILLMISRHKFPEHHVHYQEIVPGRLLHVRLLSEPCIDVIVIYQHAWSITKVKEGKEASKNLVLEKRAEIWAKLHTLINSLPKRNQVLVLGDFNCSLDLKDNLVGRGLLHHTAAHASDGHMLHSLLDNFQLVALNTWSYQGKRASTYLPATDKGHSQIDFALLNLAQCDQQARQTRPRLLPFVPCTGMRHLPLLGSLRQPVLPKQQRPRSGLSQRTVLDLQRKDPRVLDRFQAAVVELDLGNPDLPVEQLLEQAWEYSRGHRQSTPHPHPQVRNPRLPITSPTQTTITALWRIRAQVRLMQSRGGLRCFLRLWRANARLRKIQVALRRQCQAQKRAKYQQLLSDAASQPQSLHSVFQLLRRIAPATPKRQLQIRTAKGMPCSPGEALQEIKQYFYDLYHTQDPQSIPAMQPPAQSVSFTEAEFADALACLPAGKAVPHHLPPAVLWKSAAITLARKLLPQLNEWLSNMTIPPPDEWNIADIFLLLKPGKPPTTAALRPISLLHPVAKALAVLLKDRLQPAADALLEHLPQYAYLHHRSAQDALDRAFAHCCYVQEVLRTQVATPHTRKQGYTARPCRGGFTLSVDLRKAFDLMPRQHLLVALSSARVDPALTWTIMQLHAHAMMKFTYAGNCAQIETLNGIRQGCGLAPTLWSMFTAIIMHKLLEKLSVEEIVAFADDWLFQWVINEEADLVRAVELVGFILDVLKSFGMQPSLDKTVVLVSLKGSSAQRILRRYITASPKKGKLLQVRTAEGQVSLPITHQHTYLGVQIGYNRVEDATLRFRIKQSWIVFNRLLPSLRCAGLPRDLKVSVWKACAYASLVYGLDCITLSPSGAAKLRKVVARQLRLALKAPVFITRENTETFLNRWSIPNPILDVAQRTQTRLQKCQHNDMHVLQPIRTQQRWRHLLAASQSTCDLYSFQQIARSLPAAEVQARLVEVSATLPKQACPHCGVYFDSRKSLRQHISQKHKDPSSKFTCKDPPKRTQQQKRHDYMQFASGGVPTCKFCNWHFSAWPAFFEHFECKRCPLFPSEATLLQDTLEASNAANTPLTSEPKPQGTSSMPQTVPSEQTGSFASLFQQLPSDIRTLCHDGWEQLAAKVRIIDQHACPFCNQWLASPAYLSRHIAKQHVMLKPVMQKLSSWLEERRPTVFSPCQWCHRDFKAQNCSRARHVAACPTLIRTGIYVLLSRAQDPSGADGSGDECGTGGGPDQRKGASSSAPGHDGQRSGCCPGHGSHGSSSGTGPAADSSPFGKSRNGHLQPGQAWTGARGLGAGDRTRQRPRQVPSLLPRKGEWLRNWLGCQGPQPGLVESGQDKVQQGEGQELSRAGGDEGPLHQHVEAAAAPRGSAVDRQVGEGIYSLLPSQGNAFHHPGPDPHPRDLGENEGGAADHTYAAPESSYASADGEDLAYQAGSCDGLGGEQGAGPEDAHPQPRWDSALPSVQSPGTADGGQKGQGADGICGSYEAPGGASGPRAAPPVHPTIPCGPQVCDGPELQRRDCSYDVGSGPSDTGGGQDVEHPCPPVSQRGMPSHSCHDEAGAPRSIRPRQAHSAASRELVRTLKLGNQSNYCYSNATMLALMWADCACTQGMTDSESFLGPRLKAFAEWLAKRAQLTHMWQHIMWRAINTGWQQPQRQHGIVEYCQFLSPHLHPTAAAMVV